MQAQLIQEFEVQHETYQKTLAELEISSRLDIGKSYLPLIEELNRFFIIASRLLELIRRLNQIEKKEG